jgi:hypothetical protein
MGENSGVFEQVVNPKRRKTGGFTGVHQESFARRIASPERSLREICANLSR